VAGAPGGHKFEPGHALLGRLDRIKTAAGNIDAEPADLADRFGATFEELGMVVDEEACAEQATGFLIGKEGEDDIARRAPPLPGPVADDGEDHRVHVFHVDGAATPQAVVPDLTGERVDLPVGCVGRYDVQVPMD